MNFRPTTAPLPVWPTVLLCAVYLFAGLLGHDPWKFDDATHLGVAYEFATSGDWLRPRIANDLWFASPPLYHWVAALFARTLGWLLPFHDAARLATAAFGALLLLGLALAARALHGRTAALIAPLLTIGALGLLVPIHDAQPLIALLAAQSIQLFALSRLPEAPWRFGALTGVAMGVGLLSSGAQAVSLAIVPIALLPHAHWSGRTRAGIALALLIGTGLALLWPALLASESSELLSQFRHAEFAHLKPPRYTVAHIQDHLELVGWAAWPIWPVALWAVWSGRRQLAKPALFLPLIATLLTLLHIVLLTEARPLNHLALLPPLILLAAAGAEKLRRGAANAFDWFGVMTFTLIGFIAWLGGISMMTGVPERVARNFTKAEPGFTGEISWVALAIAVLLTLVWLWSIVKLPKASWRAPAHWAGGIVLMWGLLAALWMPWLDYGKTYRPLSSALQNTLKDAPGCVASRNLGDAQKASLRYFIGLAPDNRDQSRCDWLLVQGTARKEVTPGGWRKVWEGNRPGDKSERLRLYRRMGL